MGSYKSGYKSPNMGDKYSYPTYNPMNLQIVTEDVEFEGPPFRGLG